VGSESLSHRITGGSRSSAALAYALACSRISIGTYDNNLTTPQTTDADLFKPRTGVVRLRHADRTVIGSGLRFKAEEVFNVLRCREAYIAFTLGGATLEVADAAAPEPPGEDDAVIKEAAGAGAADAAAATPDATPAGAVAVAPVRLSDAAKVEAAAEMLGARLMRAERAFASALEEMKASVEKELAEKDAAAAAASAAAAAAAGSASAPAAPAPKAPRFQPPSAGSLPSRAFAAMQTYAWSGTAACAVCPSAEDWAAACAAVRDAPGSVLETGESYIGVAVQGLTDGRQMGWPRMLLKMEAGESAAALLQRLSSLLLPAQPAAADIDAPPPLVLKLSDASGSPFDPADASAGWLAIHQCSATLTAHRLAAAEGGDETPATRNFDVFAPRRTTPPLQRTDLLAALDFSTMPWLYRFATSKSFFQPVVVSGLLGVGASAPSTEAALEQVAASLAASGAMLPNGCAPPAGRMLSFSADARWTDHPGPGTRVEQQAQAGGVATVSRLVSRRHAFLVCERVVCTADQQRIQRSFAAVLGGEAQHGRVALAPARIRRDA